MRSLAPRNHAALLFSAVLCLAVWDAVAAEDDEANHLRFSVDPHLTFETGSRLVSGVVAISAEAEDRLSRAIDRRPRAGLPGRLLRTLVLDAPVAWWFGVLEHEMFGHGGRAREFGGHAGVHMGSPWAGRSSFASFSGDFSTRELLQIFAGGSESNSWTATLLERDLVAGKPMRPFELLFLASNRFVASDYVLRTTPDPVTEPAGFFREWDGGGDVAHYLGYLSTLETGDPGITPQGSSGLVVRQFQHMERQAIFAALDPGAWLAIYSVGRYVARGGEVHEVPLPRIGGRRFLPALSTDWTPSGSLYALELIFGAPPESVRGPGQANWSSFIVRRGRGPAGAIHHVGFATRRALDLGPLAVGGEAEVWDRPGHRLGGGMRLSARKSRGSFQGLVFDVGLKSAGHWPGRPAGTGPFVLLSYELPL